MSSEASAVIAESYSRVPAPHSHVVLYTLGGAVSRVPSDRTAVAYRDARHAVIIVGMWQDASDDDVSIRWVTECADAIRPFASAGFYPNYEESAAERLVAAFGTDKYRRLAAIKQKYDAARGQCLPTAFQRPHRACTFILVHFERLPGSIGPEHFVRAKLALDRALIDDFAAASFRMRPCVSKPYGNDRDSSKW